MVRCAYHGVGQGSPNLREIVISAIDRRLTRDIRDLIAATGRPPSGGSLLNNTRDKLEVKPILTLGALGVRTLVLGQSPWPERTGNTVYQDSPRFLEGYFYPVHTTRSGSRPGHVYTGLYKGSVRLNVIINEQVC